MRISVIGAGSFGTAIAQLISSNVDEVYLVGRNPEIVDSINKCHINCHYFPSFRLNENIMALAFGEYARLADVDAVVSAIPSGLTRSVIQSLKAAVSGKVIISGAKGIEKNSLCTMTQIIKAETNNNLVFSFSGPTFADELLRGYPAGVTIGIDNKESRGLVNRLFNNKSLFLDYSQDVKGVELAGVMKNIYAIALGIFDSAYNSFNAHYTFLNLCFKEMIKILKSFSADNDLMNKYCSFGDYSLTANVDKSRNRTLGLMIGKKFLDSANIGSSIIVEGFNSVKCIKELAKGNNLEIPIIDFVDNVLTNNSDIVLQVEKLMDIIRSREDDNL